MRKLDELRRLHAMLISPLESPEDVKNCFQAMRACVDTLPALLRVAEVLTSVKERLERTLAEPADEDTHQMMLCCDEIGDALAALDADPKEAQ